MNNLVIVAGPTAVGKSDIAVRLAKRIDGEIVSADSMQVYKGMDIGSAKVTEAEKDGVPHWLIDEFDPSEEFNVKVFKDLASKYVDEINSRGHIPILTGGTGFYIQALLYGIDFDESSGEMSDYRKELEKLALEKGNAYLYEMLKKSDPASCEIIHENNVKRVIRALEFYKETGKPISLHNSEQHEKAALYNNAFFVLTDERKLLYERIDKRVDKMLEAGLLDEVKRLKSSGFDRSFVSMQGIGYKELLAYLEGEISLDEAIYIIKRDSRHYAKRQITWFKREKEVIWLDRSLFVSDDDILDAMIAKLKEKGIV